MAKVLPLLGSDFRSSTFSPPVGFCLLFSPLSERIHVYSQSQKETGSVLTVIYQTMRVCGMVALDSSNSDLNCCGSQLVFHRPTQRCCSAKTGFFVIHKNPEKPEAEDCRSYTA